MRKISTLIFAVALLLFFDFSPPAFAQHTRPETLVITIGSTEFEAELYDNNATRSLIQSLPQTINMSRWGGEFYGRLSKPINSQGDARRDVFEVGEIALWPSGNALCIFFGPTPASSGNEPRMASPGVPFGKIKGDVSVLQGLSGSLIGVKVNLK